jgi:hypothetical protein
MIIKKAIERVEFPMHCMPITHLALSSSFHLISSSEDSSIAISKLNIYNRGICEHFQMIESGKIKEFGMISLEGQEVQREKIKELDFNIQNVENDHGEQKELISDKLKSQKKLIEQKNNLRLKRQKERLAEEMQREDIELEKLKKEIKEMEESHKKEIERLDEEHEKELLRLYKENETMKYSQENYKQNIEKEEKKILEDFNTNLDSMEFNFQEQMFFAQEKFKKAKHKKEKDQEKFEEVVSQMEEDYRTDIELKKCNLESELCRLISKRIEEWRNHQEHESEDHERDFQE